MRRLVATAALLALAPALAAAQFAARVQSGVRVRVWLSESQQQEKGPWHRQLLRATVSGVGTDSLRLDVPGTEGSLSVSRAAIRRLDVSLGTSRVASALERTVGFAIGGAIAIAVDNDPTSRRWPNYSRTWRAAGEGAKWGAVIGAVYGLVLPTERWRRVPLR
jgi:hypothetical protein